MKKEKTEDKKKADKKSVKKETKKKKSFKAKMNGKKLSDLLANGEVKTAADLEKCGKKAVIQYLRTKEKEIGKLLKTNKTKEAINGIYWMPKEGLYPIAMHLIEEVLQKAKEENISVAIMKARSPSCGKDSIYSGNFDGALKKGSGVTAAFLEKNGIKIFTEEEIEKDRTLLFH